jgi:N-acetylglucosaminyldiphosphoundecaprenol N-acetyl-beta-D-mannosaminyltransferase
MMRYRVLDTPVDAVDMPAALAIVRDHVRSGKRPACALAVNPEKVYVLRGSAFLKEFFEQAALLIPDGIGMVKALRFLHGVKVSRVPGADLMQNICAASAEEGYKLFIYGGREEVNASAVDELRRRYSGIQIVGRSDGYVPAEQMDDLVRRINESQANILFVALGSPGQERWLHDHCDDLTTVRLCQGIGGTLDTIVGRVRRAPSLFQRLGLEWFYRLLKQPSRAGRQLRLLQFIAEVLMERCRLRGKQTACERVE